MASKCVIIDDEPLAIKVLKGYIDDIDGLILDNTFTDPLEAIKWLGNNRVDIILLDINMPKVTGFQFLTYLNYEPIIIFTTAYSDYAVDAFEVKAFDYLVKPISFDRFYKSYNRVRQHLDQNQDNTKREETSVLIKENKRLYKVLHQDILFIKAFGDYIRIFAMNKTYISKDRLLRFGGELPEYFLQVHRSYIVNLGQVEYLEGNHLVINGEKIPVSETYRNELIKML